ncbi:hypothetical protein B0H14DRAFT_3026979 [Mycena olivaceomarginata]|nr:hypothetical protein B0H14DRAFT_3026979 [Mycena olivaceomarginata]
MGFPRLQWLSGTARMATATTSRGCGLRGENDDGHEAPQSLGDDVDIGMGVGGTLSFSFTSLSSSFISARLLLYILTSSPAILRARTLP